ncbi:MAG: bifunctional lysylphosphatidylglycerol flippase/synthetase MprF [Burkholderiaceae bacterium]|nr:bifunctional lysylphosphatidylglycerol flippase/synthetase MprF [Burkholderiaceae bacterium]
MDKNRSVLFVNIAKWGLPLLGLLMFSVASYFVFHFLRGHSYTELLASFQTIPTTHLVLALALTVAAYFVLSLYDLLAFTYAGERLPKLKIMFGSFMAFAFSNSIGLANLAGSSIRFRFYSSLGVAPLKVARVIAFVTVSFWLGFFSLAGVIFVAVGVGIPDSVNVAPVVFRWIGAGFLAVVFAYLFYSAYTKTNLRIGRFNLEVPKIRIAAAQIAISAMDWALAGTVLYVLLPPSVSLSFPVFLSIFLSAQVIALLTHVPGGIGILESIVIYFVVPDHHAAPAVVASLVIYRVLYYFLPLAIASVSFAGYESYLRRNQLTAASKWAVRFFRPLAPTIFSVMALIAGAVLLLSSSTPNLSDRSQLLRRIISLPFVELSHFLSSCVGVVLIVVAAGLANRSKGAWLTANIALAVGVLVSLVKGLDFEEAATLLVILALLYSAKAEFYRPARVFSDRWTPGWMMVIVAVISSASWVGFFAYHHVEYSDSLWWTFSFSGDAPRFLRSLVGAGLTVLTVGIYHLLSPPKEVMPSANMDFDSIATAVSKSKDTLANLALLGDKRIFQSKSQESFLMYAVQGKTWIVLGDAVGLEDEFEDLIFEFLKKVDHFGGQVAFYQVRAQYLPLYIDCGLMFLTLGEEARIPLQTFSLDAKSSKGLRQAFNRMAKQGFVFRVVPAIEWPNIAEEVKSVSDAWLLGKHVEEKGFSLGFFNPEYLSRFPIAVLELDGKILAFANVWMGSDKDELSIDLMRYLPDGPPGLMEHLIVQLLLWGKAQGFKHFNLGMAPLSGLEGHKVGSRWNRVGNLVYEHGERLYNFQGLRQYKDKFHPIWEPRFLAYQSKFSLPLVLKDLTVLIAGSVKGLVLK